MKLEGVIDNGRYGTAVELLRINMREGGGGIVQFVYIPHGGISMFCILQFVYVLPIMCTNLAPEYVWTNLAEANLTQTSQIQLYSKLFNCAAFLDEFSYLLTSNLSAEHLGKALKVTLDQIELNFGRFIFDADIYICKCLKIGWTIQNFENLFHSFSCYPVFINIHRITKVNKDRLEIWASIFRTECPNLINLQKSLLIYC